VQRDAGCPIWVKDRSVGECLGDLIPSRKQEPVRRHEVELDEDVLVARIGAQPGEVEVDRAVAVDVDPVRLPFVRQSVAVGVGHSDGEGHFAVRVVVDVVVARGLRLHLQVHLELELVDAGVEHSGYSEGRTAGHDSDQDAAVIAELREGVARRAARDAERLSLVADLEAHRHRGKRAALREVAAARVGVDVDHRCADLGRA
jgi:hypothetical protein